MSDQPDFAEFYAANFASLCGQLHAHCGDLAEAQDVVQEAFCRALSRWNRIADYDDPAAWVRKVAWNLATSRWRKVRTMWTIAQNTGEQKVPAPDAEHLDVAAALKILPERQRQAVLLHYFSDVPIAEIATLTGAAEGTVKSWLHRARITLGERLRTEDWTIAKPPGAETARQTVRRRRDRNTLITIIFLILFAAAVLLLPIPLEREPVIKPTPSQSVSPPAPAPAPSAVLPSPAAAGPIGTSTTLLCERYPVGRLKGQTGTTVQVHWDGDVSQWVPMCPGVKLKIVWASYTVDAQLNATLYRSGAVYLEGSQREAIIDVMVPSGCTAWYVLNDVPIPNYIDRASWMSGSQFPEYRPGSSAQIVGHRPPPECPAPTS